MIRYVFSLFWILVLCWVLLPDTGKYDYRREDFYHLSAGGGSPSRVVPVSVR